MNEKLLDIIYIIVIILVISSIFGFMYWFGIASDTPDKTNIKECTNVKKLYKDDILFDNFYIACDEPINLEVSPELYTRIIEGKNYIITYINHLIISKN